MGHTAAMANTLEEDRPKIAFYGLMMYGNMPDMTQCVDLRFWCGFFALDCFVESFVCLWMAMAGYTRDNLFCLYWVLHLLVALPYVLCTFTIPAAMYADDGKYCRGVDGVGPMAAQGTPGWKYVVEPVYWLHFTLFLVYVWHMLCISYYSFVKPVYFNKGGASEVGSA